MSSNPVVKSFVWQVLFSVSPSGRASRVRAALMVALCLVGALHWIVFLNGGRLSLTAHDWAKERVYLDTMRRAQTSLEVPWRWRTEKYQGTANYLGNPEVILTPDICVLPWLDNGKFILFHTLLFYLAGFWASVLLARMFRASLVVFALYWLLFNFNGHITAHLSVGHFQWLGYFLFPAYFVGVLNLIRVTRTHSGIRPVEALTVSLLLAVLLFNGSLHVAVWCVAFLLAMLFFNWALLGNVVFLLAVAGLLGAARLLPAIVSYAGTVHEFMSGYPSITALLDSLTVLRDVGHEAVGGLGWWEYDLYVGYVGFGIMAVVVTTALRRREKVIEASIYAAAGVLLLLSMGQVYSLIAKSQAFLPLAGVERVAARLAIVPFIVCLVTVLACTDLYLASGPKPVRWALAAAVPFVASELLRHSWYWRIVVLEHAFPSGRIADVSVVPSADWLYVGSVYVGWTITAAAFAGLIVLLVRLRRQRDLRRGRPGSVERRFGGLPV